MDINSIISISYLAIGFILAIYWFYQDYTELYNQVVIEGKEEKGMTSIFLVLLMVFWPIKLIKNIIKKHRI